MMSFPDTRKPNRDPEGNKNHIHRRVHSLPTSSLLLRVLGALLVFTFVTSTTSVINPSGSLAVLAVEPLPSPSPINVVLPVAPTLHKFYLDFIEEVNAVCRQAQLDGASDDDMLLVRNGTGPTGPEPLFVPGSCRRYSLVGIDLFDAPEFFKTVVDWWWKPYYTNAIISMRAGLNLIPDVDDRLTDMREFLDGTLDDHPSMQYSPKVFGTGERTVTGLPGNKLRAVVLRTNTHAIVYRSDMFLSANITAIPLPYEHNAAVLIESIMALVPPGTSRMYGHTGYMPINTALQIDSLGFEPVTTERSPEFWAAAYGNGIVKIANDVAVLIYLGLLYHPGFYPPAWGQWTSNDALKAFCRGEVLSAMTTMNDIRELDMTQCKPFGIRSVAVPYTRDISRTYGVGVTKDLAANEDAAPFVRAVVNGLVRGIDAPVFPSQEAKEKAAESSVVSMMCDMPAMHQYYRKQAEKYWGGGFNSPPGTPALQGTSDAQFAGADLSTRNSSLDAIAHNMALYTYKASCQWECHYDQVPEAFPSPIRIYCANDNPQNICFEAAGGMVFQPALTSVAVTFGSVKLDPVDVAKMVMEAAIDIGCTPDPNAGGSASEDHTPVIVAALCTVGIVAVGAMFGIHALVLSRRLKALDKIEKLGADVTEGPLEELWDLVLRLDAKKTFSAEDKVILRVFRDRLLNGKLFAPEIFRSEVNGVETDWLNQMGGDVLSVKSFATHNRSVLSVFTSGESDSDEDDQAVRPVQPSETGRSRPQMPNAADFYRVTESRLSNTPAKLCPRSSVSRSSRHFAGLGGEESQSVVTTDFLVVDVLDESEVAPSVALADPRLLGFRKNLFIWDGIDVDEVAEAVGLQSVLPGLLCTAVLAFEIPDKIDVDMDVLQRFGEAVSSHYIASNPHHNALHGTDVMLNLASQLASPTVIKCTARLDKFAALVAAAVHDVGHTGQNNGFHKAAGSDLALLYSDHSSLENYHLALAFSLMRTPSRDIMKELSKAEKTLFRTLVVEMVLVTDLSQSYDTLGKFRMQVGKATNPQKKRSGLMNLSSKLATATGSFFSNHSMRSGSGRGSGRHKETLRTLNVSSSTNPLSWVKSSEAGLILMLQMCLKVCDIGHAGKSWTRHQRWSERVSEEFFLQGDLEEELGLTVSPMCNRKEVKIANSQDGFFTFLVLPSFIVWAQFSGDQKMVDLARQNQANWRKVAAGLPVEEEPKPHESTARNDLPASEPQAAPLAGGPAGTGVLPQLNHPSVTGGDALSGTSMMESQSAALPKGPARLAPLAQ